MEIKEVVITEIEIGTGVVANKGALVTIEYTGTLEDGTVFDSTEKHGRPYQFVVGSSKIIKGMSQGMMGMHEGGRRRIWVPAELAYGERQMGLIKPHSNLIFEIQLIESRPRE